MKCNYLVNCYPNNRVYIPLKSSHYVLSWFTNIINPPAARTRSHFSFLSKVLWVMSIIYHNHHCRICVDERNSFRPCYLSSFSNKFYFSKLTSFDRSLYFIIKNYHWKNLLAESHLLCFFFFSCFQIQSSFFMFRTKHAYYSFNSSWGTAIIYHWCVRMK